MTALGASFDRATATTYASWFRCLADPTRIVILNLLATVGRPLTVGEIVAAVDVGQSTVSHHLKLLAEARFVLVAARGASSLYRVNERCIECFPSAAELIMGLVPVMPAVEAGPPPWLEDVA
jgi:DNA-binding transcriptional ArsR family regulator